MTALLAWAIGGSTLINLWSNDKATKATESGIKAGIASQEAMTDKNLAQQKEFADQQRADLEPWREYGAQALTQLQKGIVDGSYIPGNNFDFTADPGYQFRLQEGINAMDASASARGRLRSGAQDEAINRYGQNFASEEYANAYARDANEKATKYNILSQASGVGQNSASGQASATGSLAMISNNALSSLGQNQNIAQQNIGANRASGYTGVNNAIVNGVDGWARYQLAKPSSGTGAV